MFKEELAALKDVYLDRFNLVHVLSREAQDIELLHGRIDRAKADALLAHWVDLADIEAAVRLRSRGHDDAVTGALRARGFPESRIKVERFAASIPGTRTSFPEAPRVGARECEATVVIDGATARSRSRRARRTCSTPAAQRHRASVLVQGRRVLDVPLPLVEGEVDMDVNFALEDYEVERGFILACQSYPVTDTVKVTFDETGTG
jgi:ring-1,2-phenylacetyl-CoA epoxidase subunit PaaE